MDGERCIFSRISSLENESKVEFSELSVRGITLPIPFAARTPNVVSFANVTLRFTPCAFAI